MKQHAWSSSFSSSFAPLALPLILSFAGAGCDGGGDGNTGGASGGSVKIQISGEDIATDGFLFPDGSEVRIADGWEITFSHVLVSVDEAWLSSDPDLAPSDQSQTGDVIAQAAGPWVVDLAKEGSEPGAGGEGKAVLLATIDQTKSGEPLAVGERYAFSFSLGAPPAGATAVNFDDAESMSLVDEMTAGGYAVMYTGTATWKGSACETSDPAYDFDKLPKTVDFKLGFATPTSYLNCQNQENQGEPFDGEEYQRGVTITENAAALAQITLHLEHAFYSETEHEPALYFDQLAALLVGQPGGTLLTMDAAQGVDFAAFTDGEGASLPWRTCDGTPLPSSPQRAFDPGTVVLDDYRDFIHYTQSSLGHLNGGEGLCYIQRD